MIPKFLQSEKELKLPKSWNSAQSLPQIPGFYPKSQLKPSQTIHSLGRMGKTFGKLLEAETSCPN